MVPTSHIGLSASVSLGPVDYDWLVVGSGFGGSVVALRLAEKGYSRRRCSRRAGGSRTTTSPKSTWNLRRYWFAPGLGLRGHLPADDLQGRLDRSAARGSAAARWSTRTRSTARRRGSIEDAAVARPGGLAGRARAALRRGGADARRRPVRPGRPGRRPLRAYAGEIGVPDTYAKTRVGVFLGEPGVTVPDPFFGGAGPDRDGLHPLRALHGRLPRRREEHARQELPLVRRAHGRAVLPERDGGRHPPARRGRRSATAMR